MKQITTFYRLTEQEKKALTEQCRKKIEEEKIRDTETVRKILEELLAEKWDTKEKAAQNEMRNIVDELQRQVTEAQAQQNSEEVRGLKEKLTSSEISVRSLREKLESSEREIHSLREQLTRSDGLVSNLQVRLIASEDHSGELKKSLKESEDYSGELKKKLTEAENHSAEAERQTAEFRKKAEKREFLHLLGGVLAGIFLGAGVVFSIMPAGFVSGRAVCNRKTGEQIGEYTGGLSVFSRYSGAGTVMLADQTQYSALWIGGFQNRQYSYEFPNGTSYTGGLSDRYRPEGEGIYVGTDGTEVSGVWSWVESQDGYTGMILDGERYGYGTLISAVTEGKVFTGEFRRNVFTNGTETYANGDTAQILNGNGSYTVVYNYALTGSCFDGDFEYARGENITFGTLLDRMEGRFYYADGSFADGGFTWTTEQKFSDGVYTGYLLDGRRVGYGTLTYANGESYEGEFTADGLPNGNGVYRSADGEPVEMELVNGEFQKCQVDIEVCLHGDNVLKDNLTYVVSPGNELTIRAESSQADIDYIEYKFTNSGNEGWISVSSNSVTVKVPEGKPGSGFTLYIDAYAENYTYETDEITSGFRAYHFKYSKDD